MFCESDCDLGLRKTLEPCKDDDALFVQKFLFVVLMQQPPKVFFVLCPIATKMLNEIVL